VALPYDCWIHDLKSIGRIALGIILIMQSHELPKPKTKPMPEALPLCGSGLHCQFEHLIISHTAMAETRGV
jgi:hypothetical protein